MYPIIIFKIKKIKENLFLDGGLVDKAPVEELARRANPEVIIIHYIHSLNLKEKNDYVYHMFQNIDEDGKDRYPMVTITILKKTKLDNFQNEMPEDEKIFHGVPRDSTHLNPCFWQLQFAYPDFVSHVTMTVK